MNEDWATTRGSLPVRAPELTLVEPGWARCGDLLHAD